MFFGMSPIALIVVIPDSVLSDVRTELCWETRENYLIFGLCLLVLMSVIHLKVSRRYGIRPLARWEGEGELMAVAQLHAYTSNRGR